KEVIWAIEEADSRGSGVISLNGKMIDKPIVERAERVIALAKATNLLSEEE
ncbi:citrate lyase subunit beta, partial [Enterococcus faecium]